MTKSPSEKEKQTSKPEKSSAKTEKSVKASQKENVKALKPGESSVKTSSGKEKTASKKPEASVAASAPKEKQTSKPEKLAQASVEEKKTTETSQTKEPPQASPQEEESKSSTERSEKKETPSVETKKQKVSSLFTLKKAMSNVYDEKGRMIPVTVLSCPSAFVTQIKTKEKEGYDAVQVALEKKTGKNKKPPHTKCLQGHLKKSGFKNKAVYIREVSGKTSASLGDEVDINSFKKGDQIFVKGVSKGKGFSGVVKRWGFGGGPAAHGAEKHRTTGSIANTATQGRVFPGKKMPGRFGGDTIHQKSYVVDVLAEEKIILIKGPVPGAKNSLIEIKKQRPSL